MHLPLALPKHQFHSSQSPWLGIVQSHRCQTGLTAASSISEECTVTAQAFRGELIRQAEAAILKRKERSQYLGI